MLVINKYSEWLSYSNNISQYYSLLEKLRHSHTYYISFYKDKYKDKFSNSLNNQYVLFWKLYNRIYNKRKKRAFIYSHSSWIKILHLLCLAIVHHAIWNLCMEWTSNQICMWTLNDLLWVYKDILYVLAYYSKFSLYTQRQLCVNIHLSTTRKTFYL